jgi:hypothetical protein
MTGRLDDLAAVLFFLAEAERQKLMLAGLKADAAFEAACSLLDLPADKVRQATRGEHG